MAPDTKRSVWTLRPATEKLPASGNVRASLLQERESTELAKDRTAQTTSPLIDNDGGKRDVRMYKK